MVRFRKYCQYVTTSHYLQLSGKSGKSDKLGFLGFATLRMMRVDFYRKSLLKIQKFKNLKNLFLEVPLESVICNQNGSNLSTQNRISSQADLRVVDDRISELAAKTIKDIPASILELVDCNAVGFTFPEPRWVKSCSEYHAVDIDRVCVMISMIGMEPILHTGCLSPRTTLKWRHSTYENPICSLI